MCIVLDNFLFYSYIEMSGSDQDCRRFEYFGEIYPEKNNPHVERKRNETR